jgi:hypothetical protein
MATVALRDAGASPFVTTRSHVTYPGYGRDAVFAWAPIQSNPILYPPVIRIPSYHIAEQKSDHPTRATHVAACPGRVRSSIFFSKKKVGHQSSLPPAAMRWKMDQPKKRKRNEPEPCVLRSTRPRHAVDQQLPPHRCSTCLPVVDHSVGRTAKGVKAARARP